MLSIFLTTGMAWRKLPQWTQTHRHPEYPQNRYILGVGASEEGMEDAREQARLEVVRQIRVRVKSEVEHRKEAFGFGEQEAIREQSKELSQQIVDEKVSGIRIVETAREEGRYYALAALDRIRFADALEAELFQKDREVRRLLEEAGEFAEEGKVPKALESLSQAYGLSLEASARLALYRAVAPVPEMAEILPPSQVLSRIREVVSGLRMEKVSGDGQEGKEGDELARPLVVRVVGEGTPVKGVKVRFVYGDGRRIGDRVTGSDGEAQVRVVARTLEADRGVVVARVALGGLPEGVRLRGLPEARFSYRMLREGFPVAVEVYGLKGERLEVMEKKLARALDRLGYVVDQRSPILLKGQVEVGEVKEVEGFGGTKVLAQVQVTISALELPSERALGSVAFSGRGMGKDREGAVRAAMRKIKVDRAGLARTLREAAFPRATEEKAKRHLDRAQAALENKDYRLALRELEQIPPETSAYATAQELLQKVRQKVAARPRPTVAVFAPDATGWGSWKAAEALRDMLVTALVGTGKVDVVERRRLRQVLEEQKLGTTGPVDPETASRIGKLVGAEYVLLGRVVGRGGRVEVDVRLVSVQTGKVVAASSAAGREENLRAISEELTNKLLEQME